MRTPKGKEHCHIAFVYKNFAANVGISHIGLGVSALNNAKVLNSHGIKTTIWPTNTVDQLRAYLDKMQASKSPITDLVISAPWIPTTQLQKLCQEFHDVEFLVNCHSNVGFLQADSNGVKLLRENIDLEQGQLNFRVAGNSRKFNYWLREAYQCPSVYLPNMYYLDYSQKIRPPYNGGVLRIGAFGAIRPQKNLMSAAGAAIILANEINHDVEFWVSGGRSEGGGKTILDAVRQMLQGVPGIKLVELNWSSWSQFRDALRRMHLLIQVSYTESFNMVTADGIAEGVPSVVSDAIDWVPNYWKASVDDVEEIASVGRRLLYDRFAVQDGLKSLEKHNRSGYHAWIKACHIMDSNMHENFLPDPFM